MSKRNYIYRERRAAEGLCIDCGNFPQVVQSKAGRCRACRDLYNGRALIYGRQIKETCYNHYGTECSCCGERESAFLTIDHINNDGAEHRRTVKLVSHSGPGLYRWLINNNFPSGFQILCWNCQWGKQLLGICPHMRTNDR